MKREISLFAAVMLLLILLMSPLTTFAGNGVYPTTTLPSYTTTTWDCIYCSSHPPVTQETTTTTGYLCVTNTTFPPTTTTTTGNMCITNTTFPPTTTTTYVLTGPDGTAPTTYPTTTSTTYVLTGPDGTAPTTYPPTTETTDAVCGLSVDLLSTAEIYTTDRVAMLGNPAGGYWLSCDCYSYDGEMITITPTNGKGWNLKELPYLHITIRNNTPFSIEINAESTVRSYFANLVGSDSDIITKGGYVVSIDLADLFETVYGDIQETYNITEISIMLYNPGSISVGHIALSDQAVCNEAAPNIQTTTIPSFPWDDMTTGTTLPTTDGTTLPTTDAPIVTTASVMTTYPTTTQHGSSTVITTTTSPITNPTVNDALIPGDTDNNGTVSTADARLILMHIIGHVTLTDHQLTVSDVDADGVINTTDARWILAVLTQ